MSEQSFTLGPWSDLINRLRGRYAVGPIMANGEPEFGYRQFDKLPDGKCLPAIHGEAANALERAQADRSALLGALKATITAAEHAYHTGAFVDPDGGDWWSRVKQARSAISQAEGRDHG